MLSKDKEYNKGMIKYKKRNYLSEKKEVLNINKEFGQGGFIKDSSEEIWRGRKKKLYPKSNQEEKYMLNEILKKYQSNQDERKGYNYKYVLELSNLLGQKDKYFSKKRLELYKNRINNRKKTNISHTQKNLLDNIHNIQNIKTDFINKKKQKTFMTNIIGNNKYNKTYNNFYNKEKNIYNNYISNSNNQKIDFYNKTSNNYNSPIKIASLKYLLTNPKNKNYIKNKGDKIITSFYLTQYNSNDADSFDTTSLVGKEAYLFSGDREKYHEFLQKEYKFFEQPKLRETKYLFDKQKRIKLFKKLTNDKFLNYNKKDPLKIEIFNKIHREKNHIFYGKQKDIINNKNKRRIDDINAKISEKLNFYKNCKSIFKNIKNNIYE